MFLIRYKTIHQHTEGESQRKNQEVLKLIKVYRVNVSPNNHLEELVDPKTATISLAAFLDSVKSATSVL